MTFAELEQIRLEYVKKYKRASGISCAVIIPLDVILFFVLTDLMSVSNIITAIILIIVFSLIAGFISVSIATHKIGQEFKVAYKNFFVSGRLNKIFTNINYNHAAGMNRDVVRRVMTTGDRYNSNDLVSAAYKGINFSQADVHTERREIYTDSNGHTSTRYVTIFKGRFLIFDFNRNFDFNLQVSSKHFPGEVLPQDPAKKLKFHKMETESSEFNKRFKVYGQDGVDTFYILDPAFIEKIQNLYAKLKKEICLTFMDGKVYIALNNGKDSFEAPNPLKRLDEATESNKVIGDMKIITDFIDDLDLDHYAQKKDAKK